MKNIRNFQFLEVKFSIYLNRHVFVMVTFSSARCLINGYNVCNTSNEFLDATTQQNGLVQTIGQVSLCEGAKMP